MNKTVKLFALFLMSVFYTSCGQNQTNAPKDTIKSETKDTVTSRWIYTKYEYTDSIGKSLIIQNSLPRGGPYTHPTGNRFGYGIFWTRVINETSKPIELSINFPADSFEIFRQPGSYLKLFLPPGTMTIDKVSLYDYGAGTKSFLDTAFYKPTMMQRTIHPKEECLFYVALVFIVPDNGPVRTGLVLKGQDLFYRISVAKQLDSALIPCGEIVFKK
jgi:hypothetical protein